MQSPSVVSSQETPAPGPVPAETGTTPISLADGRYVQHFLPAAEPAEAEATKACRICGYPMPLYARQCQQMKCGAFQHPFAKTGLALKWLFVGPVGLMFGAYLFDPTVKDIVNSTLYDPALAIQSFEAYPHYISVKMRNEGRENAVIEDLSLEQTYVIPGGDGQVTRRPLYQNQELVRRMAPPNNVIRHEEFWQQGEFVAPEDSEFYAANEGDDCKIVFRAVYSGEKSVEESRPC